MELTINEIGVLLRLMEHLEEQDALLDDEADLQDKLRQYTDSAE